MKTTERTLVIGQRLVRDLSRSPQPGLRVEAAPRRRRAINDPSAAAAFTRALVMASLKFEKQRQLEEFCARQFQ